MEKTKLNNREYFMNEAIALAKSNISLGNGGPFGAVIVKNGEIVGKSANKVLASNDPSAHAEVAAIRDACKNLDTFDLSGCILYTSCESCPMCLFTAAWANITEIYFAADRLDADAISFKDNDLYSWLKDDVKTGIFMPESKEAAVKVMNEWKSKQNKMY